MAKDSTYIEIAGEKYYKVTELAKMHAVSTSLISKRIRENKLISYTIGGTIWAKDDEKFNRKVSGFAVDKSNIAPKITNMQLTQRVLDLENILTEQGQRIDRLNGNIVTLHIMIEKMFPMTIQERKEYIKQLNKDQFF